ncbi:MAG TPA: DUF1499 domain-containing protein [Candidatus Binataceae bacterium]|nr:DUF1499 domain-containing protein [Candidatus Binataceae bacterium]
MIPAWLSLLDAILAVILLAVGIGGAHFYLVAPMLGFQLFLLSVPLAALAFLIGLLGIARTGAEPRRAGRPIALAGTILGLVVAVPLILIIRSWMSMHAPLINDITTDFDNPPEFVKPPGMSPEAMKYRRDYFAPQQIAGYGKLEPLHLDDKPAQAFAKVNAAAHTMPGWEIVWVDPGTRTIEGIQRSDLFRFCDDFVIQVRPAADGAGSVVEMRSRSRDGKGDFAVNYHRIEDFFAMLKNESAAKS